MCALKRPTPASAPPRAPSPCRPKRWRRSRLSWLEEESERGGQEVERWEQRLQELDGEARALEAERVALESERAALSAQVEGLRAQLAAEDKAIADLEAELSRLGEG